MRLHLIAFAMVLLLLLSTQCGTMTESMTPHEPVSTQQKMGAASDENQTTLRIGGSSFVYHKFLARDLAFSTLLEINESLQLVPNVAKAWNVSADAKTYNFLIDNKFRWQDGMALTAEDIAFTIDAIQKGPGNNGTRAIYPTTSDLINRIDNVTVIDNVLQVHLTEPFAPMLSYLGRTYIIPKHVYENRSAENAYDFGPEMIGSGPFKFKGISEGYNLTLEANPYYPEPVALNEVQFKIFPDTELPTLLENNEIDLIPQWVIPQEMAEMANIPGLTASTSPGLGYDSLDFNLREPIVNETLVRQGIACAIDRDRIVNEVFLGYAQAAYSPVPSVLADWYNENVSKRAYNVTESNLLLDEAGYPVNETAGSRFDLLIKVGDWESCRQQAANVVAESLRAVNINASVETRTLDEMVSDLYDYPLNWTTYYSCIAFYSNDPTYEQLGWSSNSPYGENGNGYNNSQVDALLELAINTTDMSLRRTYMYEFQDLLAQDVPSVFLITRATLSAFNNDFHNFTAIPSYSLVRSYCLKNVYYEPALSVVAKSPVRICVVDSEGRKTGYDSASGQVLSEIPDSAYSGADSHPQMVKVRSPLGNYSILLTGTGTGEYHLEVVSISLDYKYTDIATGTVQTGVIQQYVVQAMADGTITVEQQTTGGSSGSYGGGRPAYVC